MLLDDALARWRTLLGDDHVWTDAPRLEAAATATFPTRHRVAAVIRPADRDQVVASVQIACSAGVPLHPVSGGRNWGYGSRAPRRDAVVVDLSRLDRIVDFDERLAYVTVEPGVTFRRLAAFLRDMRARVFASVTGGPADGSVIANALERGDGSGRHGDRFGHVCGLEVVLPTGERIETGFGRFPGAAVAPLARWGLGPSLDGLFSQSGLGIVTRMTIWLTPYPERFELATFALHDDRKLASAIDAARTLRLTGVVGATIPLWNDFRALTMAGTYPWAEAGGATPLPDALRAELCRRTGLGRWNGTASLYGASARHLLALRELVEHALGPVTDALAFHAGPEHPLDADPETCGPALGVAHDHHLASMYWRKPTPPTRIDPDADRCGFLWLSHAVPFTGDHARAAAALIEGELYSAGFEPGIALLGVGERALSVVAALIYDRDVPGEDARAQACHDRVHAKLLELGYPPFRGGIQTADPPGDPAYARLVDAIAGALDPHAILRR